MNNTNDRLADLLQRFLNNSCTRQELLELLEMIEQFPDSENIRHVLREQWHTISGAEGIPDAHAKLENLLRASRAVATEKEEKNTKGAETVGLPWQRHRRRFAAAAAITLILASVAYLFFRPASTPEQVLSINNPHHDIAPGGEKATLTLADGTAIALDSNGAGMLAQQGGMQVIKLDSGQLAYRPAGDAYSGRIGYNTLTTPRGGQFKVTLPDGTRVWLNAASSLRYPAAFTDKERKVTLSGEAYFEVASRPLSSGPGNGQEGKMPFIVRVNGMEIEVLGTHFNVMAYEDESVIRTTLLEGAVKVIPLAGRLAGAQGGTAGKPPGRIPGKAKLLRPGQQARLAKPGKTGATSTHEIQVISGIDTRRIVAWKDGYFQFKHTDLPTVMRHLARWYNVEVIYNEADTIPDQYFGGRIPRNLPLSKVLSILQQNEVRFRIKGRQLIILK